MATYYVDSAASGANDGSSKADAWTDIASAASVAAGSDVWISHTSSQINIGSAIAFTNSTPTNPVRLLSVNFSTDALTPGAELGASGVFPVSGMAADIYSFGVFWYIGYNSIWESNSKGRLVFDQCTFVLDNYVGSFQSPLFLGRSSALNTIHLKQCTIDASAFPSSSSVALIAFHSGRVTIDKLSIIPPTSYAGPGFVFSDQFEIPAVEIRDSDLSALPIITQCDKAMRFTIRRCLLKSGYVRTSGTSVSNFDFRGERCSAGTLTVPSLGDWVDNYFGVVQPTLSRYRTGGAFDGLQANAYCWEMTTSANALEIFNPLESPPLAVWADPDAAISGATAQGIFTSTRCAALSTPAALTTDSSSTWNGSGVGTKQKISHTLTNGDTLTVYVASGGTLNNDDFWIEVAEPDQVGGPVVVRCCLAKPSTTVYVDPKLEVA